MDNSEVYYTGFYWNDLQLVKDHLNKMISGDKNIDYIKNFKIKSNRKFRKALVLNCGNGHVERAFIENGVVESAIGIDISENLISEANSNKGNMDIEYIKHDINTFDFNSVEFDLLIVFAAGHHIQFLNKVFDASRKILIKNDGMIVGFDYIGPHRNQYPHKVWEKVFFYNEKLPSKFKNELIYPHLPTMLVTDPSEAIHSEFLEKSLKYYFDLNFTMLGGGIAYEILTHNKSIQRIHNNKEEIEILNKQVSEILSWDINESKKDNSFNFFASFYGYPKNSVDEDEIFEKITKERIYENKFKFGENYYQKTLLQTLTEELSDTKVTVSHKQSYIEECLRNIGELKVMLEQKQKYIEDSQELIGNYHKEIKSLKNKLYYYESLPKEMIKKIYYKLKNILKKII